MKYASRPLRTSRRKLLKMQVSES